MDRTDFEAPHMVFDPRSIPAFPTPLRRVIGHHWPWYRLPGPMAFLGPADVVAKPHVRPALSSIRGSWIFDGCLLSAEAPAENHANNAKRMQVRPEAGRPLHPAAFWLCG